MPFFVENPADQYGNRAYTASQPRVVEANVTTDDLGREKLHFVTPEMKAKFLAALESVRENGRTQVVGTFSFSSEESGGLRIRQEIWRVDTLLSSRPVHRTIRVGLMSWPLTKSGLPNLAKSCARDDAAEMLSRSSFASNPNH